MPLVDQDRTADIEAITACALDYAEGWYKADPVRMRRALHPDLSKRTIIRDPFREDVLTVGEPIVTTADRMVRADRKRRRMFVLTGLSALDTIRAQGRVGPGLPIRWWWFCRQRRHLARDFGHLPSRRALSCNRAMRFELAIPTSPNVRSRSAKSLRSARISASSPIYIVINCR